MNFGDLLNENEVNLNTEHERVVHYHLISDIKIRDRCLDDI